jgi:hypothetical protein
MKVRAFDSKAEENEVFLKLENCGDSSVYVAACDKNGKKLYSGYLLRIDSGGVRRCGGFNPEAGIAMRADGTVMILDSLS